MKGDLFNYVKKDGIINGNLVSIVRRFLMEFIGS